MAPIKTNYVCHILH